MKRIYAEQLNNMLQQYYFNCEDNPQGHESHYAVLASGIQHLYGIAFCSDDNEAVNSLRPIINSVFDREIPRPVYRENTGKLPAPVLISGE